MRKLASVQKIINLEPIKGKDRIEVATILGWSVIVEKGKYKIGDLVIYCEYDTILPQKPEFEFLRSRCFNSKYQGFRIRNMKMANIFSQGIVFSIDILSSKTTKEGKEVTKELGIVKYDPELKIEMSRKRSPFMKFLLKIKWFRKIYFFFNQKTKGHDYPNDISKSSEDNIQTKFNKLKLTLPNELYYKTEKLEGQAGTFEYRKQKKTWRFWQNKKPFKVYSHNIQKKTKDKSNWWRIAESLKIEEKLKKVGYDIVIQGEIVGTGIQKNIYSFNELKLFVYRIKNLTTGKYLEFKELKSFCKDNGFEMVPILEENIKLPETVKEILKDADGITKFNNINKKRLREGVVWRGVNSQEIGFKARSPKYLLWWEKKEDE